MEGAETSRVQGVARPSQTRADVAEQPLMLGRDVVPLTRLRAPDMCTG